MDTYTLDIRPDGDYTYINIPELDYATQASHPGDIERMGRDLIATLLDIEPDTYGITIHDPHHIISSTPISNSGTTPVPNLTAASWRYSHENSWLAAFTTTNMAELIADGIRQPDLLINRIVYIDNHPYHIRDAHTLRILGMVPDPYNLAFRLGITGPRITH